MKKISGNILPLAIVMTFVMLLSGITIGSVVLNNATRARETDDSVAAYYMAESGIERELFEIRKNRAMLADVASLQSSYPNASTWISTAGLEQPTSRTIPHIRANDFVTLDFFDPDAIGAASDVDQMIVSWTGNGNVEISYAQWTPGQTIVWPSEDAFVSQVGLPPTANVVLDPIKGYRIRLRAVDQDAEQIEVRTLRNGAPQAFPGDISLGAEGTYGKATQKIVVTMPKLDVLSGVFQYVLFSECNIVKGVPGPQICP